MEKYFTMKFVQQKKVLFNFYPEAKYSTIVISIYANLTNRILEDIQDFVLRKSSVLQI